MARPVAADAEATKARILTAALKLVSERGIDGSSVRDIAAGAKVTCATVLHYYGSKNGLYEACIDAMYSELDEIRAALFAALRPGASMEELVKDAVRAALTFVQKHRPAHRILLRTVLDEGGMKAHRRERYLRPFLDDVANVLAPALGQEPLHARLSAQSIVHLAVRYALHSPAELRLLTSSDNDDDANARLEQHLLDVARALLLEKRPRASKASA